MLSALDKLGKLRAQLANAERDAAMEAGEICVDSGAVEMGSRKLRKLLEAAAKVGFEEAIDLLSPKANGRHSAVVKHTEVSPN